MKVLHWDLKMNKDFG